MLCAYTNEYFIFTFSCAEEAQKKQSLPKNLRERQKHKPGYAKRKKPKKRPQQDLGHYIASPPV